MQGVAQMAVRQTCQAMVRILGRTFAKRLINLALGDELEAVLVSLSASQSTNRVTDCLHSSIEFVEEVIMCVRIVKKTLRTVLQKYAENTVE